MYQTAEVAVADGWSLETVTGPSRLGGANGMTVGPDGRLYVTQVFASQVTAIDPASGAHELYAPLGGGIVAPDDAIFGADGTFYATEPFNGRVTARNPDGSYRVVRDNLPAANGVTMDHARRRLFIDEFRPGGRLLELDPTGSAEPRVLMEDLNGPNAPAMGPDGRLYFPQVFANQIWRYDLETGRGELAFDDLNVPTAVKFDSQGRLVTSESGAGQITRIELESGARTAIASVPQGIDNLSLGEADRLFVSHYVDGRVAEEGATTRVLSEPGLLGPYGLSLRADGSLLAADGLSIAAVAQGGEVRRLLKLLIELHVLAVGVCEMGADTALVALSGELLLYPVGNGQPQTLASGLDRPSALLAESNDSVLVTERGGRRLTRVRRDGGSETVLDGLRLPGAVARGDDGTLYVSQGDSGAVLVLAADGSRKEIPGFGDAQGIAVSGRTLLVADVNAQELRAVDLDSGEKITAVSHAPIGQPAPGVMPWAFAPLCADGSGGFYAGCNGDGSVRRLRRR
jgi:sugar lactone lactonase YvrE